MHSRSLPHLAPRQGSVRCRAVATSAHERVELRFRKPLLYPAELRGRKGFLAYPQGVWETCLGLRSRFCPSGLSPKLAGQIAAELEERFSPTALRQHVATSRGFSHLKNPVPLDFTDRVILEKKWSNGIFIGFFERSIPHAKSELKRLTARISDFWSHVMSAVRSIEDDDKQNDFEKAMKGQGFGSSPAERRAIEDRAVAAARKHFERKGFQFQKSFRTGPYDLEFTKRKTILHVEVKGTTTHGKSVILTRGEVDYHRDRPKGSSGLFVLHSIKLKNDRASGGLKHICYPWNLKQEKEKLSPIFFTYVV
jgi:hypothetical protein